MISRLRAFWAVLRAIGGDLRILILGVPEMGSVEVRREHFRD